MLKPILRASTSPRWMHCPESAWLEQQHADVENEEAREGTAAHEMAQCVLTAVVSSPEELVDRQATNGVVMSGDMVPHVKMYVDHVQARGVGYWIEKSITIPVNPSDPANPVTGKTDSASFNFDESAGILYVDDFKYGFGLVEVFENWQLLIYAIGVAYFLRGRNVEINTIVMSVIQPRGYHPQGPIRTWTISYAELEGYMTQLASGVERVYASDETCNTGAWCRHCKHMSSCNAAKIASMNAVDVALTSIPDTDTPDQISVLLDTLDRAFDAIKHTRDAVNSRAENMITVHGMSISGRAVIPGKGNRKYRNDADAKAYSSAFGVSLSNEKLCTPAEAERRAKNVKGFDINVISFTPSTAPKLVKTDASKLANEIFKK